MVRTLNDHWNHTWLFLLAVYAVVMGCQKEVGTGLAEPQPRVAKEVAVVQARLEPWPETIRVQGSLLAYEDATVGSKLAGRVDTVAVDIGTVVKAGDPLVTLVR